MSCAYYSENRRKCHAVYGKFGEDCLAEELQEKRCLSIRHCPREAQKYYGTQIEGLPKALIEAAAVGRALIASDIAGCREVVTPEVTGLLVQTRSAESLEKAMLRLGEDATLRRRLAQAVYEKAVAVFGQEDVVKHTFRVYDELLAGTRQ